MSLSGSSASRKSICAMTRFASSSSMKVGRKMMRSLSRREKISNARSPRGVCSITIGTKAIRVLLLRSMLDVVLRVDGCVLDEEVERLALAQTVAERVEITTLFHHTPDGRRGALTGLGDLVDLGIEVAVGHRDRFLVGDGLQQEGAAHRLLGARPELADELLVVPLHTVGVHALPAQTLARVFDLVRDLSHHHGLGDGELVALQRALHQLVLELAALLDLAAGLELRADFGAQGLQRVELPERLGEVIVKRGKDFLLHLGDFQTGGAALAAQRLHAMVVGGA